MTFLHRLLCGLALSALATTSWGGSPVELSADHGHSYTTLASFDKGEAGPHHVASSLIAHPDGHFYGTSYAGGPHDAGTVFRLAADGTVTVLHAFAGHDGRNPSMSPLLLAGDGHLYGTTNEGGASNGGTAFRLRAGGGFELLHSFGGHATAPRAPNSGLVEGADGHLYGTSDRGGKDDRGTVFRMRANGEVKVLHAFFEGCTKGCFPRGLVDGADGFFYGLTVFGGTRDFGTAYRIDPEGNVKLLHHFIGAEGRRPLAPLLRTSDGSLFGATSSRGRHDHGTVFRMERSGEVSVLAELNPKTGSTAPARLAEAEDGALYLATLEDKGGEGAVVRVDREGVLQVVHRFSGREGGAPWAGLVRSADGALVGATQLAFGRRRGHYGTIYAIGVPDRPVNGTAGPARPAARPAPRPSRVR